MIVLDLVVEQGDDEDVAFEDLEEPTAAVEQDAGDVELAVLVPVLVMIAVRVSRDSWAGSRGSCRSGGRGSSEFSVFSGAAPPGIGSWRTVPTLRNAPGRFPQGFATSFGAIFGRTIPARRSGFSGPRTLECHMPASHSFSDLLALAIDKVLVPVCVGIDPVASKLPWEFWGCRRRRGRSGFAARAGSGCGGCALGEGAVGVFRAVWVGGRRGDGAGGREVRGRWGSWWCSTRNAGDIGSTSEHYAAAAAAAGAHAITVNGYLGAGDRAFPGGGWACSCSCGRRTRTAMRCRRSWSTGGRCRSCWRLTSRTWASRTWAHAG